MSPTVSHCLPLAATRLSLLLNPHPKAKYGTPYSIPTSSLFNPYLIPNPHTKEEKLLCWNNRRALSQNPQALSMLVLSTNWAQRGAVGLG